MRVACILVLLDSILGLSAVTELKTQQDVLKSQANVNKIQVYKTPKPIKSKRGIDAETPLQDLINTFDGDWEERETSKLYWFGYTDVMRSIAFRGDECIKPLVEKIKSSNNTHTIYGCLLTLHYHGINRYVIGRYSEKFRNPKVREALLSLLTQEKCRDTIMRLLIRDPWQSDVPYLIEVLKKAEGDTWAIVNGLFRYDLENKPMRTQLPTSVMFEDIKFIEHFKEPPNKNNYIHSTDLKNLLYSFEKKLGNKIKVEKELYESKNLWGYISTAIRREGWFKIILDDVIFRMGPSYTSLGVRFQYYIEDDTVHICSIETAKERWLNWWNEQSDEYKGSFLK